jgi:hypothetical protein
MGAAAAVGSEADLRSAVHKIGYAETGCAMDNSLSAIENVALWRPKQSMTNRTLALLP